MDDRENAYGFLVGAAAFDVYEWARELGDRVPDFPEVTPEEQAHAAWVILGGEAMSPLQFRASADELFALTRVNVLAAWCRGEEPSQYELPFSLGFTLPATYEPQMRHTDVPEDDFPEDD